MTTATREVLGIITSYFKTCTLLWCDTHQQAIRWVTYLLVGTPPDTWFCSASYSSTWLALACNSSRFHRHRYIPHHSLWTVLGLTMKHLSLKFIFNYRKLVIENSDVKASCMKFHLHTTNQWYKDNMNVSLWDPGQFNVWISHAVMSCLWPLTTYIIGNEWILARVFLNCNKKYWVLANLTSLQ